MALERISSNNQKPSLSSDLKSIANSRTSNSWNGKVFTRLPKILAKSIAIIKSAWNAKSLKPDAVNKQMVLNEVARTVTIIQKMKSDTANLDMDHAKTLISEAHQKVSRLSHVLGEIKDAKRQPWINNQKGILDAFAIELEDLLVKIPDLTNDKQTQIAKNLESFLSIKLTSNTKENISNFLNTLSRALQNPPKDPFKINKKTFDDVAQQIPDAILRFREIQQETDPVNKLIRLANFCVNDILGDTFGLTGDKIAGDDFAASLEFLLRAYPEESLVLITDFLSIDLDKLEELVRERTETETNQVNADQIRSTNYTLTTLYVVAGSILANAVAQDSV